MPLSLNCYLGLLIKKCQIFVAYKDQCDSNTDKSDTNQTAMPSTNIEAQLLEEKLVHKVNKISYLWKHY